jgi:hypothetical protein
MAHGTWMRTTDLFNIVLPLRSWSKPSFLGICTTPQAKKLRDQVRDVAQTISWLLALCSGQGLAMVKPGQCDCASGFCAGIG